MVAQATPSRLISATTRTIIYKYNFVLPPIYTPFLYHPFYIGLSVITHHDSPLTLSREHAKHLFLPR